MPKSKPPRRKAATNLIDPKRDANTIERIEIFLTEEKRRELAEAGYKGCILQYYTTNGSIRDVEAIRRVLFPINPDVHASFQHFSEPKLARNSRIRAFEDGFSGKFKVTEFQEIWFNYLVLIFPYTDEVPDPYFLGKKPGAMISLFFGERSARELHLEFSVDLFTGAMKYSSPPHTVYPEESKLRRDLSDEFYSQLDLSLAKPDTIEMLGLAKQNENEPLLYSEYLAGNRCANERKRGK